jgi:hypothetical protein
MPLDSEAAHGGNTVTPARASPVAKGAANKMSQASSAMKARRISRAWCWFRHLHGSERALLSGGVRPRIRSVRPAGAAVLGWRWIRAAVRFLRC